jgi:hypothetical protein
MKLVATKGLPHDKTDRLQYLRDDGSSCENAMPRQGILPHDLVHFVVESGLGLGNGFLSLVARGANAAYVMEQAHERRNEEIERQAIQAEALVEALQTQLWNGGFDREAFLFGVATASRYRGVEPPPLEGLDLEAVLYTAAAELHRKWSQLPARASMALEFASAETVGNATVRQAEKSVRRR